MRMTVAELRKQLKGFDGSLEVRLFAHDHTIDIDPGTGSLHRLEEIEHGFDDQAFLALVASP